MNNQGYCSIRSTQKNYFNGNFVASNKNSGLEIPNLRIISNAFGFKYYSFEKSDKNNFKKIIETEGNTLIDIKIVEEEALMAKSISYIKGRWFFGFYSN